MPLSSTPDKNDAEGDPKTVKHSVGAKLAGDLNKIDAIGYLLLLPCHISCQEKCIQQ